MVLEFTGGVRLNPKSGPSDHNSAFMYWSGGYLHNVGSGTALGLAGKLTADSDGHRFAPVIRYRRWVGGTQSLDLAAGAFVSGMDNFVTLQFPSPTWDIAYNLGDRLAFGAGLDILRREGGGADPEGHVGVRFGTWLAPLATLGLGLLIGATW